VGIAELFSDLKAHLEHSAELAASHGPALASIAEKAASNPVIDAVMNAAHLSPDWFTALADVINRADAALGVAADATAAAQAQAAAAAAAAAQPEAAPAA
jgi:hypothetical protein